MGCPLACAAILASLAFFGRLLLRLLLLIVDGDHVLAGDFGDLHLDAGQEVTSTSLPR
jgi:hypothetical protein